MPTDGNKRHGCLAAWIILMIIANSATAVVYLFAGDAIRRNIPNAPNCAFPVLSIFSLLNLICSVALLKWKKWGFWGFCVSGVVALAVNVSLGLPIVSASSGLVGVLLLFAVLHIGKENKGWPQLQ